MFNKIKSYFNSYKIRNFYTKYEASISPLALVLGFALDNLSLSRVDAFMDELILFVYIILAGFCIILLSLYENEKIKESVPGRMHFWLLFGMQFALGGLFSAFVIFYTRSATLESSWPFLLLLILYFIGNEVFKKVYAKLSFRVSVYFFALLSFCLLIVPNIIKQIGDVVFLISTFVSVVLLILFMITLRLISNKHVKEHIVPIRVSILVIIIIVSSLYYTNAIPPLPLLLKKVGVYHNLVPLGQGNFKVIEEKTSAWDGFWNSKKVFSRLPNEPVYVVSSVYSPKDLDTLVIHNWEYFDIKSDTWISKTKIKAQITGGSQIGYRMYSYKNNVFEGLWRVNIETSNGKLIGRIKFEIKNSSYLVNPVEKNI